MDWVADSDEKRVAKRPLAGLTFLAFTCLMLSQLIHLAFSSYHALSELAEVMG